MGHMRCVYSALSNCPNRSWSKCLHTEYWDGGGGLGGWGPQEMVLGYLL